MKFTVNRKTMDNGGILTFSFENSVIFELRDEDAFALHQRIGFLLCKKPLIMSMLDEHADSLALSMEID